MRYVGLLFRSVLRVIIITVLVSNMALDIQNGKVTPRTAAGQIVVGLITIAVLDFFIEAFLISPSKRKRK